MTLNFDKKCKCILHCRKLGVLYNFEINCTYIDDDLTKEERETQKKLRELAREEKDRGKRVKIGYRKIQINGEWFRWDEREEKLKNIF
jgi:hypothetical protein